MKQLYAPWREAYSSAIDIGKKENALQDECVFCKHFNDTADADNFIIRRFKHMIVMLNRFPYNAGHILILPKDHKSQLHDLSQEARYELIDLVNSSTEILTRTLRTDGINVGVNIGKAAGAGIPSHLHMHVLPRFHGDTNFLPTLADVKAISYDLHKMYELLKGEFNKL